MIRPELITTSVSFYIDAGVGGLFIQVLIAGSIGALFYFRSYLKRAKAYLSLLLKEMVDFHRFFLRTPKAEKAVVFYAEHEGYYLCFEGLIEKLTCEYNQTLCYITSDPNDPILQSQNPRIKTFYLKQLLPFFMAVVNCQVFVMTLTDLNQFHLKRSINPVHYAYVFHALVSTHMMYRHGAFDHYDSILCCGPHQVKEIRRHEKLYRLPPKRLVEAGYYPLEQLYEDYRGYSPEKPPPSNKGTVLIAPSWGVANILEHCGVNLVGLLLKAGYEVIVRPHPETIRRSPRLIDSLTSKFDSNPNFTLEMSVATYDSLLKADVLISDCSGVALEYAFGTERPVLFVDVPIKIKNREFRELGIEPLELSLRPEIGVIVSPDKLNTIPKVITGLMVNRTACKNLIVALRKHNVYAFGHSSDIGAEYVANLVGKN